MPRTTQSICTPACDAAYSASIMSGSTRLLSFIRIRPLPGVGALASASARIRSLMRCRSEWGATEQLLVPHVAAVAGEVVEQLREVGAEVVVAS